MFYQDVVLEIHAREVYNVELQGSGNIYHLRQRIESYGRQEGQEEIFWKVRYKRRI